MSAPGEPGAAEPSAAPARPEPARPGPVARTDHTFEFTARAPLRAAFPLFGAWGERAWAGEAWDPRFLWPDPPRDEEGEVFTLSHGERGVAVWVNTAFDLAAGRIQYVYVLPGTQVTVIDLALAEAPDGASTRIRVRYRRTALEAGANAIVEEAGRKDAAAAQEWEGAVDAALRPGLPSTA
ncbi:MAG: hypothetical protein QM704_10125 [Anaeromyxobacteraceae bacterium]